MNRFQKHLLEVYAGGEFAYCEDESQIERAGDSLLLFLFRELADAETQEEANERLEAALRDMEGIVNEMKGLAASNLGAPKHILGC